MITPDGRECEHYYEDFHRGRERQECRLIKQNPDSLRWEPKDCSSCPVPDILWANASPHLQLKAEITKGFLGFGRKIEVTAYCNKHQRKIDDPMVGCKLCAEERPDLSVFFSDDDE